MFKSVLSCLALSAVLLDMAHADQPSFEITPFFTQRGDGGFIDANNNNVNLASKSGMAAALNWAASDHGSQYELLYSRQNTKANDVAADIPPIDMRIEYLQLGGTTVLGDAEGHVVPFASGGIGAARFTPGNTSFALFTQNVISKFTNSATSETTASFSTQETHLAFSLGAGVRIPITKHVRLRFEARGYLTWLNGNSSLFCSSGPTPSSTSTTNVCPLQAKGQTFFQYEALGGVSVGF